MYQHCNKIVLKLCINERNKKSTARNVTEVSTYFSLCWFNIIRDDFISYRITLNGFHFPLQETLICSPLSSSNTTLFPLFFLCGHFHKLVVSPPPTEVLCFSGRISHEGFVYNLWEQSFTLGYGKSGSNGIRYTRDGNRITAIYTLWL